LCRSPYGILCRTKHLSLLDDTSQFTQVHGVCASPSLSLLERCYSYGLSYKSEFYSSSLSSIYGITDNSIPYSPDIHNNIKISQIEKEYKKELSSNRFIMPSASSHVGNNKVVKEVMISGGGIGFLVGIVIERFVQNFFFEGVQNIIYSLVPKLLESTTMLDVQNVL
jgi:hypothetical protein